MLYFTYMMLALHFGKISLGLIFGIAQRKAFEPFGDPRFFLHVSFCCNFLFLRLIWRGLAIYGNELFIS